MMVAGLVEIAARGKACESYLTSDPEATFFQPGFKRHTRFTMQCVDLGPSNGHFIKQGRPYTKTCVLSDCYGGGDLVGRTYVAFTLPALKGNVRWVPNVGHALIKQVTLKINDSVVDCHTGEWLYIWSQLSVADKAGLKRMLSPVDASREQTVFVPLEFQFCKYRGSELPLARMAYCNARLNIETVPVRNVIDGPYLEHLDHVETHVYADFIKLDERERRDLVRQERVESLITQVERNVFEAAPGGETRSRRLPLRFDGDIKELVFVCRSESPTGPHDFATKDGRNPVKNARLMLHGNRSLRDELPGDYYHVVQPFQHHSGMPAVGINVYSFALEPESYQPSGTHNMDRADCPILEIDFVDDAPYSVTVYATKINVLCSMLGIAGTAYPYYPEGAPALEHLQ